MLYKKTGLPAESDIVLCTVTNIQYSSVFVNIDHYNVSGMIHISEIAAGRIRNIRDYVKEGKKIVCKVLRIYPEKGHVDLSLRRVNERERRIKVNQVKFEQKAESIIEHVAKENNMPVAKLYDDIAKILLKDYEYIHQAFEDIVSENLNISELGLDKKIGSQLEDLIIQRFKPKAIEIGGVLTLTTYESDGIDIIRKALFEAQKIPSITIKYLGGGRYNVTVTAADYKEAETKLREASGTAITLIEKNKGNGEFKRS
jgi:translation initiation factor 2 subunit 1